MRNYIEVIEIDKDGGKQVWDDMWSTHRVDENVFFQFVVEAVVKYLPGSISEAKILEAGSGPGTSSFQLAKRGASVTLVDYSQIIIDKARDMFDRNGMKAEFICGDIRCLPIEDDTFDLVFNSGVMEHFPYEEQVAIISEMTRICKPGGRVITMNPNARCIFYRVWKNILEKSGKWIYGTEIPVLTMSSQYADAGLRLIAEHSIGFENALLNQFGVFTEFRTAVHYILEFYRSLPSKEQEVFEGYLLCSVGEKKK